MLAVYHADQLVFSFGPLVWRTNVAPVEKPDVIIIANKWRNCYRAVMDEGRKRVIGIMAAILASLHMERADDLFGAA
jgi:hypothetical protein